MMEVVVIDPPEGGELSDQEKLAKAEALIAKHTIPGRVCGDCSLCCKLLRIDEFAKPAGRWCEHARPGKGCGIYASRPNTCRGFACSWLVNTHWGDEWRPTKSRIVACMDEKEMSMRFVVDPNFPQRWREEPYHSEIIFSARAGLTKLHGFYFPTYVEVGDKLFLILPNQELLVPNGGADFSIFPIGEDKWHAIFFEDKEQRGQFRAMMEKLERHVSRLSVDERMRLADMLSPDAIKNYE